MGFVQTFVVPIVSLAFIGGIVSYVGFVVYRGVSRTWKQQTKWFIKYKIKRKEYPEKVVGWCLECFEDGVGYYDAKKLLFVKNGTNMDQVYETLYIYDKLLMELHSKKNNTMTKEEKEDGRKFERSYCEDQTTELPTRNSKTTTETN